MVQHEGISEEISLQEHKDGMDGTSVTLQHTLREASTWTGVNSSQQATVTMFGKVNTEELTKDQIKIKI